MESKGRREHRFAGETERLAKRQESNGYREISRLTERGRL